MHAKALVIVLLLAATAIGVVVSAPAARSGTLINSQLVEETGATAALGGGDHVFVRFGDDAAFGVVYGTTANPNNIYIVAIEARYLGVAQVFDQANTSVATNRPIKIYTLYALKLDSLIEFRDGNGNNIADYARAYNSTTGGFTDYYARLTDTLYKKVDLRTNWTRSPIVEANGTTYRNWTFSLSAQNLTYAPVANYTGSVAGVLPLVRFTFHLNASLEQVDNASVPQWRVTVGTVGGNTVVTDISRMANLTGISGKVVHYDLKWDQNIEGWTFAAGNAAGARRRILVEFGAVVGNLIPAAIVDAWFQSRVMARMGETGWAQFTTAGGTSTANDTTRYLTVQRLASPNLDFTGNSTRIADLVWVGTSTVDGVAQPVFGEVVGGFRLTAIGERGNAFVGFVLLAGLSFRGGASIIHDPTVTTDIQADLQLPTTPGAGGAPYVVAAVAALVIAIALIVAVIVMRRRKRETPPPPPPGS